MWCRALNFLHTRRTFGGLLCVALLLLIGCDNTDAPAHPVRLPTVTAVFDPPLLLDDHEHITLVRPTWITQDEAGRYYISDSSDRDIKVYDSAGRRQETVGGVGEGPGEFLFLRHAFIQHDSLFAYDLGSTSMQVFPLHHGSPARSLTIRLHDGGAPLRVLGADSLFLVARASQPPTEADLLELWTPDGLRLTSFFDRWELFGSSLYSRQFSQVQCDAHAGTVFTALSFSDSVYAFDYRGVLQGAGAIDDLVPLARLATVAPGNAELRGQDWRTLMSRLNGDRWLKRIVALPESMVAMQVAVFDADMAGMLEGGTVIIGYLSGDGPVRNVLRVQTDAELMGRDASGHPLLLRYADQRYEKYEVIRMRLSVD